MSSKQLEREEKILLSKDEKNAVKKQVKEGIHLSEHSTSSPTDAQKYTPSFAVKGNSGVSFGGVQLDIRTNDDGRHIFEESLRKYTDFSEDQIEQLIAAASIKGTNRENFTNAVKRITGPNLDWDNIRQPNGQPMDPLDIIGEALSMHYKKIDSYEEAQINKINDQIKSVYDHRLENRKDVNQSKDAVLGSLSVNHPDFQNSIRLLAGWGNRSDGVTLTGRYLKGEPVHVDGRKWQLQGAPTYNALAGFVYGQRYFRENRDDFPNWTKRMQVKDFDTKSYIQDVSIDGGMSTAQAIDDISSAPQEGHSAPTPQSDLSPHPEFNWPPVQQAPKMPEMEGQKFGPQSYLGPDNPPYSPQNQIQPQGATQGGDSGGNSGGNSGGKWNTNFSADTVGGNLKSVKCR